MSALEPSSNVLTFTLSPDFDIRHLPGWYVVNTWLQRQSGRTIALQMFDDFTSLHHALDEDRVDIIFANAFDAARLVREQGYIPLAKPHAGTDEAVIAVTASSPFREVEDLRPGLRAAATDNPEVELMGLILLEPADLTRADVAVTVEPNHVSVAKALLYDDADIGFFLAATFDDLSRDVSSQLRVLVRSEIFVITHLFLIHPRLASLADTMRRCLMVMDTDAKGLAALDDVGIDRWEPVEQEEVEFMIDLMHALEE
jgi:phosphonate transport system substrate-binding protein